jgi:hypothetical protein
MKIEGKGNINKIKEKEIGLEKRKGGEKILKRSVKDKKEVKRFRKHGKKKKTRNKRNEEEM